MASAQSTPVQQWDVRYGGTENDELKAMKPTPDGGYILGGWSSGNTPGNNNPLSKGGMDYWVIKINNAGIRQWDARFGGSADDYLSSIEITADGGYIVGGHSYSGVSGDKTRPSTGESDYWVVKINSTGAKQWDATFGGTDHEYCQSVQQTADGGYIVAGSSASGISGNKTQSLQGMSDYWMVKLDATGQKQWDAAFGGKQSDELKSVSLTSDGGYILGGSSESWVDGDKTKAPRGGFDYWIVKVNNVGTKQWDAAFGGDNSDYCESVQQTVDGGYILGGFTYSGLSGEKTKPSQGGYDYWVVKTDANGALSWDASFGGSEDDRLYLVKQSNDGGYILGGKSMSGTSIYKTQASLGDWDYWVVKLNSNGIQQWDAVHGGSAADELTCLEETNDGGYLLGGSSWSGVSGDVTQPSNGGYDFWIAKFSYGGALPVYTFTGEMKLHPNPATSAVTVTLNNDKDSRANLHIVSMSGAIVKQQTIQLNTGTNNATIPINQLPNGLYSLRLISETVNLHTRFVKQ